VALVALTLSCATQHIDLQAAEKHYDLAADYMGKRLVAAALRECEEALKANPNYADAHYLLGAIKLGLAVQDLEVAGRTSCLKGPQAALGKKGAEDKLREAEAHFKHASELRVDYSEALDGLAAIALHFQDWDRAVALEASALKNPVFAENHIARSNLAWAPKAATSVAMETRDAGSARSVAEAWPMRPWRTTRNATPRLRRDSNIFRRLASKATGSSSPSQ